MIILGKKNIHNLQGRINMKNKIQKLKKEGKTCKEVSKILGIEYSKCFYYYNEEARKKAIQRQIVYNRKNEDKRDMDKYRAYQKKYQNNYYHSPEHHERMKKYHRDYQKKRYDALKGGEK